MQAHIEQLQKHQEEASTQATEFAKRKWDTSAACSEAMALAYSMLIKDAYALLETEKQQIIDAYHEGQIVIIDDFMEVTGTKIQVPENDREDAEQYYKEKYGRDN